MENLGLNCLTCFFWLVFPQEEISEDDVDENFKNMFQQLAGEVSAMTMNTWGIPPGSPQIKRSLQYKILKTTIQPRQYN